MNGIQTNTKKTEERLKGNSMILVKHMILSPIEKGDPIMMIMLIANILMKTQIEILRDFMRNMEQLMKTKEISLTNTILTEREIHMRYLEYQEMLQLMKLSLHIES